MTSGTGALLVPVTPAGAWCGITGELLPCLQEPGLMFLSRKGFHNFVCFTFKWDFWYSYFAWFWMNVANICSILMERKKKTLFYSCRLSLDSCVTMPVLMQLMYWINSGKNMLSHLVRFSSKFQGCPCTMFFYWYTKWFVTGEGALYGVDINVGGILDSFANFVWEPSVVKV